MSRISSRTVKGKKYLYLEESFKAGQKWVKETVYLGPDQPPQARLLAAFEELRKKCLPQKHAVLVPPLTEFIANKFREILANK